MKPIFFSLLLLISCLRSTVQAQTSFAPAGSEWYHNAADGVFHCFNAGDSIILGKTCSSIRQIAKVPSDSWAYDHPTIYTYASGDTVYIYNQLFKKFTPLYIFNVTVGDTIRIPGFHAPTFSTTDTVFSFRVDSVRMVLYDTALLKTVYTTTLTGAGGSVYSTYGEAPESYGAYAEKIGCIKNGIYPACKGCAVILEYCECIGSIRCYNDPEFSLKLAAGLCLPPTVVKSTNTEEILAIYPNPANNLLNITAPAYSIFSLLSIEGKPITTLRNENNTSTSIETALLASGIYLLSIYNESNGTQYMRVQIAH
ncbi:MAG: T9SS type A sorting domain-containing protein [Taibaiella sp.]|nr:T9SS type A sorting domain-containing protein [Taibaiella sp.]